METWFSDYVGLEESASRLQTYEIRRVGPTGHRLPGASFRAMYLDKPDEIEVYTKVTNLLAVDAHSPADTRKFLANQLKCI